ncbi:MAG: GTP-binding protein [Coriobacteriales bacterium]|nr:GTP-binding protein [Coriobacteriales bacterium]
MPRPQADESENNMQDTVQIELITGYLGAGKTTLLNKILGNERGVRAAVIVNDIGEVNIDADLIAQTGAVTQVDDTLVPLTNGCICCTLADDLARQLTELAESGKFDHIIIEASGICEPIPIAFTIDNFCKQEAERGLDIDLDNIIAVVDSKRMFDQFNGGRDLLDDDIDEEDIEALLIQQIEFCTTLVLNKCDLVTPEQIAELKAIVRSLQKDARIVEATNAEIDLDELLNTGRFDFNDAYNSAAWLDAMEHPEEHEDPEVLEYDIATFVYERRKPFSLASLEKCIQGWPDAVIRTKGLVWIADDPNMAYVLEQAGKQVHMQENGWFIASAPEDDFKRIVAQNPEVMDDWDEECGDRMTKLVFIGRHMDKDALIAGLDACLVPWVH